jgi:DNA-binding Xre family transcriptional regulator
MPSPAELMAQNKPWRTRRRAKKRGQVTLACLLREVREKFRLSNADAAKGCAMSLTRYWKIENGDDVRLSEILTICAFFERRPGDLWPDLAEANP